MIVFAFLPAALLAAPLFLAAAPQSDGSEGPQYAGAAVCEKCHPAESKAQAASEHAHALAPAKKPQPGQWAFGAGDQAITFVSRIDVDHYREEPLSWYRRLNGYAPTPGVASARGTEYRLFHPSAAILRCFSCHSTGPLELAKDEAIVPHELGVRCEACHGPAAAHVRDPVRVRPRNPGTLSSDRLNELCGACHRMPLGPQETVDFRDAWNVRHQPPTLTASRCFRESQGRLSCLSCHSPHARVERRVSAYDAVCRNCHAAPRHSRPIGAQACAGCHMPEVKVRQGLIFANHRIAIYSPSNPLLPVDAPPTNAVP